MIRIILILIMKMKNEINKENNYLNINFIYLIKKYIKNEIR